VTVTVNPEPVLAGGLSATVCSGAAGGINLTTAAGSVAASGYNISAVVGGGLAGTATTGNNLAANAIAGDVFTNTTSNNINVVYTITPRNGSCLGDPVNVTLTVKPVPLLTTSGNETICSSTNTSITLTSSNNPPGTQLSWTVVQSGVTGASAGSGTFISQKLTTTASATGTATYTITPSANGCIGVQQVVVVTVNPIPNVATSVPVQTICDSDFTNINLTNPNLVSGTTFTWTVSAQAGIT
jgi:hypothetical protein